MSDSPSFADLANVRAGDVKKPEPLPTGHYRAMIAGPMSEHKAKSGNVAMRFPIKILTAEDDVDTESLEAAGGIPEKARNVDFWMSADAQYRFTNFCHSVGVFDENLTLIEMAERLAEEQPQFTVEVKQEQDQKDPEKMWERLDNLVGDNEIPAD